MTDSAATPEPNTAVVPATSRKPAFVTGAAHNLMSKAAQKLNITNIDYASAAIAYFALSGLDPTSQETHGLISVQEKVAEVGLGIRKQNADIGNRLVAIIRTWEANQYKFMQAQQEGIIGYFENIEANILNHQVAVESQVLAPLLERLVRTGIETHMNRVLTEILLLKFKDSKFSPEELKTSTSAYDGQLDRRLISEVRKLLETATVAAPIATQKPRLAVPIVGAPAKPTGAPAPPNAASSQLKN